MAGAQDAWTESSPGAQAWRWALPGFGGEGERVEKDARSLTWGWCMSDSIGDAGGPGEEATSMQAGPRLLEQGVLHCHPG